MFNRVTEYNINVLLSAIKKFKSCFFITFTFFLSLFSFYTFLLITFLYFPYFFLSKIEFFILLKYIQLKKKSGQKGSGPLLQPLMNQLLLINSKSITSAIY